ncbi:kinase-like protein [Rhizophagus irregularis]|uniref:Kinase-like protein n=1 Tax=Rhizophagus irregularis TaxID=588596 RepID=A0A2I1GH36_9GLOM|nr:kinase-like protein [Rhizophagus irregularis]
MKIFIIPYTITTTNTKRLKNYLDDVGSQVIHIYNSHDFENLTHIASGGFSLVHVAYWKNTVTKVAIKKFNENSKEDDIINEINIMRVASHPSIIQFYGIAKFKDKPYYSLVLEYADGGTLKNHLRNNAKIKWESQLKFAKEIAAAILWLHCNAIIHGDLHPNNILIHKNTIKLADFGCSRLRGNEYYTKPCGIIPYMDPKILGNPESYDLTEKSDIYSLGVIFWELTSCSSPFDSLVKCLIKSEILKGTREKPIPNTNIEFVALYEVCWKQEPDERPDIRQVISELNSIEPNNFNSQDTGDEDLCLSSCEVI